MPATAPAQFDRAQINRANSRHSTGPGTQAGKIRSSLNALSHGLTARDAVLQSEDRAEYEVLHQNFLDEFQPATTAETQLVRELADTSWRLRRVPLLEAALLGNAPENLSPEPLINALAKLGFHGARLSRQFQNTLVQLREIQAERREHERRDLKDAASILVYHQHKGLPWQPSDHGFVFSLDQVERYANRLMAKNKAGQVAYFRFDVPESLQRHLPA